MRYLCLYKPATGECGPTSLDGMARMGKFVQDETEAGVLVSSEALLSPAKGARVRLSNGNFTVTDGPFAETKEVIAGLAIINADSKEEAVQAVKRFLNIAGDGETEVRELYDAAGAVDSFAAAG